MEKFIHSVTLDKDLCKGCINCIKRCPTEAIRVRDGKAHILAERCIDCGECIRICPHHAKKPLYDPLTILDDFKYTIALPPPSLYGQYNNLEEQDVVLAALLDMGFDDVYEVAKAAELVSDATRRILQTGSIERPVISSACPAVTRLIRVRFPQLIDHVLPLVAPIELAARLAKKEAVRRTGLPKEDIGCIFITPCPAKVTAIRNPIGHETSAVDGAISVLEIYGLLSSHTRSHVMDDSLLKATSYGIGWANSGGEAVAVCPENSLAVDGIENVIRVLEEVENNKLSDLTFLECSACTGGCVGGPLNFENNYVARSSIRRLVEDRERTHPEEQVDVSLLTKYPLHSPKPILPNSAMQLDDDIVEAMRKMERIEEIYKRLPGYDCGSCGSPTCRTFAEDIVRGYAREMDCIHILKEQLKIMAQQMVSLAQNTRE